MRVEQAPRKPGLTALLKNGTALASRPIHKFLNKEDGSVTAFSFVVFVMMLVMGGIALDTMRQETARASLQATLDRAVLAGAQASTSAQARDVIEDYFDKAGLGAYLLAEQEDEIDIKLNSAKVSARAERIVDTYLMKFAAVDQLKSAAGATAEVTIPKLEVAMVLDNSGSMQGSRMTALRPAAVEFVQTVMENTEERDAVISIVPYSWSVSPPKSLFEALNVSTTHQYSRCLEFSDADYDSAAMNPATVYQQMLYTSKRGTTFGDLSNDSFAWGSGDTYNQTCYPEDFFQILPYATKQSVIEGKINSLQAAGSTSTNEGIKWGAALLDPAFAPVVTALQVTKTKIDGNGNTVTYHDVDPLLSNMPATYDTGDTLKVMLVMSDGKNDYSYRLPAQYRGENSNLYEVTYQEQEFHYLYDRYDTSRRWYGSQYEQYCSWSRYDCKYRASGGQTTSFFLYSPHYDDFYNTETGATFQNSDITNIPGYISHERIDWDIAWGLMTPEYYKNKTGSWGPYNEFGSSGSKAITPGKKDAQMEDICDAANAAGITIYTVAFEMGSQASAANKLRDCASTTSHHFNATTFNIKTVFNTIAVNVKQLRLTQ